MKPEKIKIFPIFNYDTQVTDAMGEIHYSLYPDSYGSITEAKKNTAIIRQRKNGYVSLGAYANGCLVGYSQAQAVPTVDGCMKIQALYVHKDFKSERDVSNGCGVGSRLLCATEDVLAMYGSHIKLQAFNDVGKFYLNRGYIAGEFATRGMAVESARPYYKRVENFNKTGVFPLFHMSDAHQKKALDIMPPGFCADFLMEASVKEMTHDIMLFGRPAYVYYLNGDMAGMLQGKVYGTDVAEIERLFVAPDFQQKYGIGASLVLEFMEFLKFHNVKRLVVNSIPDSVPFYESNRLKFHRFRNKSNTLVKTL